MFRYKVFSCLLALGAWHLPCQGGTLTGPVTELREVSDSAKFTPYVPDDEEFWIFKPGEIQLDIGYARLRNESKHNNRASNDEKNDGFAVGAHYYVNRYFSAGAEYFHTPGFPTEDMGFATIKARIPVDEMAVAIVLLGGVGGSFGGDEQGGMYQVGAGFEVRLLDNVSLTLDYRFMGPEIEIQAFRVGLTVVY